MNFLKTSLADLDFTILGAALLLVALGIMSIFSAGMTAEGVQVSHEYVKQIIWALTGLVLMVVFVVVDYSRIKDYAPLIYAAFMIILVYTRLFGRVTNGARSWIGIGEAGIQPSEFTKLAVILFLARYLENSEHESPFRRLLVSFAIILLPVGLILSQPDFGTSLVFFPILLFMIVVAGLDWRYIVFIMATAFLAFFLIVLPLWEKYILAAPTKFLFVLYNAPYIYFLMALAFVVLALSAWGWLSYKKEILFLDRLCIVDHSLRPWRLDPCTPGPEGLPDHAAHCLHGSKHRSAWFRLEHPPVRDRYRIRGLPGKRLPSGNPEPLPLLAAAEHGLHLLDHSRGMGLHWRLPRLLVVLRVAETLLDPDEKPS